MMIRANSLSHELLVPIRLPSCASDSRNNDTIRSYSEHLTLRGCVTLVGKNQKTSLAGIHAKYICIFDDAGINLQFRQGFYIHIYQACVLQFNHSRDATRRGRAGTPLSIRALLDATQMQINFYPSVFFHKDGKRK